MPHVRHHHRLDPGEPGPLQCAAIIDTELDHRFRPHDLRQHCTERLRPREPSPEPTVPANLQRSACSATAIANDATCCPDDPGPERHPITTTCCVARWACLIQSRLRTPG